MSCLIGLRVSSLQICRETLCQLGIKRKNKSDLLGHRFLKSTHLHLSIGPARNLNNHVENGLLLVGIQGDIMEWRNRDAIFLNEDAVLESVG